MKVIFGAGNLDRVVEDPQRLLAAFRRDEGSSYQRYKPTSSPDVLVPEDLAVTVLVNSRFGYSAFKSVLELGPSLSLSDLPRVALEHTMENERHQVATLIAEVASWPGFAASLATKLLHKKRPALIPILDNQAIFGAYLYPAWPAKRSRGDSVWDIKRIRTALDAITIDLTRLENADAWAKLRALEPELTLIEVFDAVWWKYFRTVEPVEAASPVNG